MITTRVFGFLSAFGAVAIWGSMFTIKSYLLLYMPPVQINFINAFITVIIYFILNVCTKTSMKIDFQSAKKLFIAGVAGISLTRIACDMGVKSVGGVTASVFSSLIPIMCIIYESFLLKRQAGPRKIIGILISILGILIIVSSDGMPKFNLKGYFWLLISNCAWIFYCYYCSNFREQKINENVTMFYQFLGVICLLFPLMVFTPVERDVCLKKEVIMGLLFLGIANGVLAFRFFSYAAQSIGILMTNLINNFSPVITLLTGFILFRDEITLLQFVGIMVTVLSVVLVTIDSPNKPPLDQEMQSLIEECYDNLN